MSALFYHISLSTRYKRTYMVFSLANKLELTALYMVKSIAEVGDC